MTSRPPCPRRCTGRRWTGKADTLLHCARAARRAARPGAGRSAAATATGCSPSASHEATAAGGWVAAALRRSHCPSQLGVAATAGRGGDLAQAQVWSSWPTPCVVCCARPCPIARENKEACLYSQRSRPIPSAARLGPRDGNAKYAHAKYEFLSSAVSR